MEAAGQDKNAEKEELPPGLRGMDDDDEEEDEDKDDEPRPAPV
jgi:hypothetical protein